MVPFMGQITIRGLSVDLPALDEDAELDQVSSLGDAAGLVSGFEFSGAWVPALELEDVTLVTGKIGKVRAGETSMTGTRVRSVEFAGCELGALRWTGGKISRTRFSNCLLVGARFEDVTLDHVSSPTARWTTRCSAGSGPRVRSCSAGARCGKPSSLTAT